MIILQQHSNIDGQLQEQSLSEVNKYMNAQFLEAVVAACCYITSKQGALCPLQEAKIFMCIKHSEELSVFSRQDIVRAFSELKQNYDVDVEIGHAISLNRIRMLKDQHKIIKALELATQIMGEDSKNFGKSSCPSISLFQKCVLPSSNYVDIQRTMK